ncbi:hypothetical protein Dsin_019775 [Dipteronia sinensis]|uniref:KIB1-4 beta-propeller domain-containing protein n=1 Tax=Dipteronia sinensis TaxID=43782 RepID=A0AAE0A8R6_9ROSI|nr:hypothetical protein Dsin_019775 [Dipteronia sinensis]
MELPVKRNRIDSTPPPCSRLRWSDIDEDVLRIIFKKLNDHDFNDVINTMHRCGNVCISWRSVARSIIHQYLLLSNVGIFKDQQDYSSSVFPYIYPEHSQYFKNKTSCVLFDLITKKVRKIYLPKELKGRWFTGSSFGWLLTICIESLHKMCLINPFLLDQKIELPSTTKLGKRDVNELIFNRELRVIASTNPLDPNCVFVSIGGDSFWRSPAFCKLGDKSWTVISNLQGPASSDVMFYKGEFYVVDSYGNLLHVNLNSLRKRCLTRRSQEEKRWSDVEDIGNNVILLGKCSSISIPVDGSKAKCICICGDFKANCIYFIDDVRYWNSNHTHNDAGVYNMASHRIDLLPESWPIWTSPVNWLRPMF